MIDREEILTVVGGLSLALEIVEKDYVLGWLLAGIYAHDNRASSWTFIRADDPAEVPDEGPIAGRRAFGETRL